MDNKSESTFCMRKVLESSMKASDKEVVNKIFLLVKK